MIKLLFAVLILTGCSISPGMHMQTDTSWIDDDVHVYIPSLDKNVKVESISSSLNSSYRYTHKYMIGVGDQIAITIWGLPDIFPITNLNPDQNLRNVDSNGNIFFPYTGLIQAKNKTQNELREDLTKKLSSYFNDPQVDLKVAKYNSQQIFLLGEVTNPKKINITDIPVSLSDAIGESNGLNTNTASAGEVFIIRQSDDNGNPKIYHADLKSPSSLIIAGQFYLKDNDIVYVNSSGTTRWNKVISQFFPFSSFLNSIDNLTED